MQVGELAGNLIGKTHYRISADARLTQSVATLGGALVRNEIEAVLEGPGIALGLNGLYLGRERQHIDNTILVEHASGGSTSDQFYKGVLDGQAQAVFAGRIVVQRDAQQYAATRHHKKKKKKTKTRHSYVPDRGASAGPRNGVLIPTQQVT